jgi:SAM-dependent MidA family methyltransferase
LVDVGAGGGELLREMHRRVPTLDLVGVDVPARPADLPSSIAWAAEIPDGLTDAVVIANEWLDDVPVDIVEVDDTGVARLLHVDPSTGVEALGQVPSGDDAEWLLRWWPLDGAEQGRRAEIGRTRDASWASVVQRVQRGVLVAIDYFHDRADRPAYGTLTGYRAGRLVPPVPDGSCDITAHVALDACASAGEGAGAAATLLTTQRVALRALDVDGSLPPRSLASSDPTGYVAALSEAAGAAELLDPAGLGGFGWLVQTVGRPLPDMFATLVSRRQ